MYAGYDTTASVASNAVWQLAKHPEVWDKVKEEQAGVVAEYGPVFTEVAVEAMVYTEAVVKEAMRVMPPLAANFKIATKTFGLAGRRIPKGWMVVTATGSTAQYFNDRWPMDADFRPERFLTGKAPDACQDMVFGLGAHTCIGSRLSLVENTVVLATLARGYVFSLVEDGSRVVSDPMPRPENGLPVCVTRRGDPRNQ
ncbi:unnamed protein product [Ostreobium quekettii]|uniref:Cytochrome P450 n=1 Tax=Ostreobium quekettii TaxID=121088 RepID=A0A8S1IY49_9CHLO|nr:unnamed protein product [Ostreobium quekettii]